VDGAGKTAFDPVRRGLLINLDRTEQFSRHILEVDRLPINSGRERIAAIELRPDVGQAANNHAGALGREVIGIARSGETVDGHARHALQRFSNRSVGKGTDVLRSDDVDDGVGIALDVLRAAKALADAGDDDRIAAGSWLTGGVRN